MTKLIVLMSKEPYWTFEYIRKRLAAKVGIIGN